MVLDPSGVPKPVPGFPGDPPRALEGASRRPAGVGFTSTPRGGALSPAGGPLPGSRESPLLRRRGVGVVPQPRTGAEGPRGVRGAG